IGAVYQPLFTAFGPKAIEHRLEYSAAKVVVTNPANRGKLDEVANLPRIATILGADDALRQGDIDFRAALAAASPACEPVMRRGQDLFMMMSTSGTTGLPKGVPVPLSALMAFGAYARCDRPAPRRHL
ncbi:AMP-binding protein, partial [Mesorhizobium sp. M2E.F.Ca.ET.219.01.1.1]